MTFESSGAGSIGTVGKKDIPAHQLEFDTTGKGGLIGLHIVNMIFMILTLMLYRFWALTRVRRAIWPRMRLEGSPFEYVGTGLEIFIGFLKVFFVFLLPIALLNNWASQKILVDAQAGTFSRPLFLLYFFSPIALWALYSAARFLAFRYRVNRTQWRSIRGAVQGKAYIYAANALAALALTVCTLGFAKPWTDIWLFKYKMNNASFGKRNFNYEGTAREILPSYLMFLVCILAFLGLYIGSQWGFISDLISIDVSSAQDQSSIRISPPSIPPFGYLAIVGLMAAIAFLNYQLTFWRSAASHTSFGATRFQFTPTRFQAIRLIVGNWLIAVLSLGLLAPFVWLRKGTFMADHLTILGDLDSSSLVQSDLDAGSTGEGFLTDFDVA
jgi:uncharacterized membrane protein YjgN (DUF898 family)